MHRNLAINRDIIHILDVFCLDINCTDLFWVLLVIYLLFFL
jgi:hypothetical protein